MNDERKREALEAFRAKYGAEDNYETLVIDYWFDAWELAFARGREEAIATAVAAIRKRSREWRSKENQRDCAKRDAFLMAEMELLALVPTAGDAKPGQEVERLRAALLNIQALSAPCRLGTYTPVRVEQIYDAVTEALTTPPETPKEKG